MSGLLLQPVPHDEAMAFIKGKPIVSQRVFKKLLPELKARAFAVAGIESATVLQKVRDRLADLPKGAQWDDVKKDVMRDISPFLVTSEDPEEAAAQERGAKSRAELLLRIHGFQSYSAAAYRELDEQRDVFSHWKYLSMEDTKVRHTHAALNGVILPSDSPFWRYHYPPWEWGCRCQVVGITEDEVDEIRAAEQDKPSEERAVIEGSLLKNLEELGQLNRGMSKMFDVRSSVEKGDDSGFSWEPGSLKLPLEEIKARYDEATWSAWETWARAQHIESLGQTVWEWMGGSEPAPSPAPAPKPKKKAAKKAAAKKAAAPAPAPSPPPVPGSTAQGTPLSLAVQVAPNMTQAAKAIFDRAMKAIDQVHGDGAPPPIPITNQVSGSSKGT